jgi:hypothetical protein
MYTRNLFGIAPSDTTRTMIYPLGEKPVSNSELQTTLLTFTAEVERSMRIIQEDYTVHLANQQYANIPTDYARYLQLYGIVQNTLQSISPQNANLRVLLRITRDGLQGSLRVYDLFYRNIELTVQNATLRAQIQDLIDGVNIKTALESTGTICVTRTFTLAPIFSYYILVYGMPKCGQGFDEDKLNLLIPILEANGVQPFS